MKKILLFLGSFFMTLNFGCMAQTICGTFLPSHEVIFGNDSSFRYSKWFCDADSNSFGYNCEGKYQQIDKHTYILNSYDFNPDSIRSEYDFKTDTTIKGFRIKISTELMREDFDFHHSTISLLVDNNSYEFNKAIIDTTFRGEKPKSIGLKLVIQTGSVIPNSLFHYFTSIPVETIPQNSNYVKIHFPVSGKFYNWHPLVDRILYRKGKGKATKYYLLGDNWSIRLKKE
jgi:hypothetical protein